MKTVSIPNKYVSDKRHDLFCRALQILQSFQPAGSYQFSGLEFGYHRGDEEDAVVVLQVPGAVFEHFYNANVYPAPPLTQDGCLGGIFDKLSSLVPPRKAVFVRPIQRPDVVRGDAMNNGSDPISLRIALEKLYVLARRVVFGKTSPERLRRDIAEHVAELAKVDPYPKRQRAASPRHPNPEPRPHIMDWFEEKMDPEDRR